MDQLLRIAARAGWSSVGGDRSDGTPGDIAYRSHTTRRQTAVVHNRENARRNPTPRTARAVVEDNVVMPADHDLASSHAEIGVAGSDLVVGPMARAILERFGDPGWSLILGTIDRAKEATEHRRDPARPVIAEGMIFDECDLARQPVAADGWLTIGIVRQGSETAVVSANLQTAETRLFPSPLGRERDESR